MPSKKPLPKVGTLIYWRERIWTVAKYGRDALTLTAPAMPPPGGEHISIEEFRALGWMVVLEASSERGCSA